MGKELFAAFQNRSGCEQTRKSFSVSPAEWIIKQTAKWNAVPHTSWELAGEIICFPVVRRHRRKNNWAWPLAI